LALAAISAAFLAALALAMTASAAFFFLAASFYLGVKAA
jgi:hypothetical protein